MIRKSLLWELSQAGCPKSYLFGTMHVQDNKAFTHWDKAQLALSQCDYFCSEINLSEAQSKVSTEDYLLPNELRISSLVTPRRYAKMCKILMHSFNFDLDQWDRFLPMIVINRLAENLLSKDNARPLDSQLWAEATKLKLSCDGLETLAEQLRLLKSLAVKEQLQQLEGACRNISKFRLSITRVTNIYEAEDISNLYKLTKKSLGNFKSSLLYDRNRIMARRIKNRVEQKTFYAVGAAHLAGAYGVLPLLKELGYRVKPIMN